MSEKTLRDEFAMAALTAIILGGQTIKMHHPDGVLEVPVREGGPKLAYMYADAMLEERDKDSD